MGNDDLTDKQRDILETKKKHSDWSNEKIAVETDSSASYVSQVTNEYDESDLGNNGVLLLLILALIIGVFLVLGGDSGTSSSVILPAASATHPRIRDIMG